MSDIVDRLNTLSDIIVMGEKIAWGSDSAIMREAAAEIEKLRAVIQFILDNQISERRSEHIDCVIIHGEPIRAARAAIREGGND